MTTAKLKRDVHDTDTKQVDLQDDGKSLRM